MNAKPAPWFAGTIPADVADDADDGGGTSESSSRPKDRYEPHEPHPRQRQILRLRRASVSRTIPTVDPIANGVVSFVSNDAIQHEKRGPTFWVKLHQGSRTVDQSQLSLGPGMAVSAELMTDKRRLIAYLLDPVRKTTNESCRQK